MVRGATVPVSHSSTLPAQRRRLFASVRWIAGHPRRTEQRSVVLQLERLIACPMVRERVDAGKIILHGWHYVIEEGEVHVFDVKAGAFIAASNAEHAGTGPYHGYAEPPCSP